MTLAVRTCGSAPAKPERPGSMCRRSETLVLPVVAAGAKALASGRRAKGHSYPRVNRCGDHRVLLVRPGQLRVRL
jgi:hypothetical protein